MRTYPIQMVVFGLILVGSGCARQHPVPEDSVVLHVHGQAGQFMEIQLFSDMTVRAGINGELGARSDSAYKTESKKMWPTAIAVHKTVQEGPFCHPDHKPCIITITRSGIRKRYVLTHSKRYGELPQKLKDVLSCMSGQVNW